MEIRICCCKSVFQFFHYISFWTNRHRIPSKCITRVEVCKPIMVFWSKYQIPYKFDNSYIGTIYKLRRKNSKRRTDCQKIIKLSELKFHKDWIKIVDFLLIMTYFGASNIFLMAISVICIFGEYLFEDDFHFLIRFIKLHCVPKVFLQNYPYYRLKRSKNENYCPKKWFHITIT